jgi:protein-S-isoprenylcysteine O-methyltransferase Ste14
MPSATFIRAVSLLGPVLLAWGLIVYRKPNRRMAAAAFLAAAWATPSLLALNLLAARVGWWSFHASGGVFLGFPIDFWIAWGLLWGALPVLAAPRTPLWILTIALAWFDLVMMPALRPVVELGQQWLAGELVLLLVCFVPAQLLGRWTLRGANLRLRALMQVVAFSVLTIWVIPMVAMTATSFDWRSVLTQSALGIRVWAVVLAVPAAMAAAAVLEFADRGGGTPFPWDPPVRLVTSGPYAYVSNPMQLSMTLILCAVGLLTGSWGVALAGVVCGLFGAGFAAWQERGDLEAAFGEGWREYRRGHRTWLPRWRPRYPGGMPAATLYFAATCVECSSAGRWFAARQPVALDLVPAELFPSDPLPRRITYVASDGSIYAGVAALARATDHLTLAWAAAGWVVRLPVVVHFLQILLDAVGGGERTIERSAAEALRNQAR